MIITIYNRTSNKPRIELNLELNSRWRRKPEVGRLPSWHRRPTRAKE